jgi:hypothetical protein
MGGLSKKSADLRGELDAAILVEVERLGLDGWSKDSLVKRFMGRGASRTTLYRWVSEVVASGRPGQHVAGVLKAAVADRAAREADPSAAAAAEVGARLPAVVRIDDVVSTGAMSVIEHLNRCVRVADQVIDFARHADGKVRNSKLLLAASEHLRRNLETAAKITDQMLRAERVERFHAAIIEEIGLESPALAERVAMRLARLSTRWAT